MIPSRNIPLLALSTLALALAASTSTASAQVQVSGKLLPLELAETAANAAIRSCEASGYRISVSVVDAEGVERVALRGDRSTIHTRETAFKKAYTIVTLGPIFGQTNTGELTEKISKTPTGPALGTVTNIILLAGGVAIRSGNETIAAIGVGGAPGGGLDQACALAGAAAIQDKVNAM
jgi:uncharacterized protein GlcG (DUF336 family)